MAGRDNVIFYATVASGTSAGTVVPLTFLYGVENVRQGYGAPILKNARAYYTGMFSGTGTGVPVSLKNSNWIDESGLVAQAFGADTVLNRDSLAFMRGRDKALDANTAWTIAATLPINTTSAGAIYVILEIEYSDVPGRATDLLKGSPVMKKCSATGISGSANTVVPIGSFDNLLQNVTYVLGEVSAQGISAGTNATFLVLEGFSNQRGLVRIIPIKASGLADPIEGSVDITKQTYNLAVISSGALSSASPTIMMEMIASKN